MLHHKSGTSSNSLTQASTPLFFCLGTLVSPAIILQLIGRFAQLCWRASRWAAAALAGACLQISMKFVNLTACRGEHSASSPTLSQQRRQQGHAVFPVSWFHLFSLTGKVDTTQ